MTHKQELYKWLKRHRHTDSLWCLIGVHSPVDEWRGYNRFTRCRHCGKHLETFIVAH